MVPVARIGRNKAVFIRRCVDGVRSSSSRTCRIEGFTDSRKGSWGANPLGPSLQQRFMILVWAIPDGVLVVGQSTSMIVPGFVETLAGTADGGPLPDYMLRPLQPDF